MTRQRSNEIELEAFEEGVSDLNVEEKYVEVKQLIAIGKEKGFLLYDEIYETLPEEVTSLPEELDEIYIRFNDLGIEVVEDADKLPVPKEITIDGAVEDKEVDQREEVQADIAAAAAGVIDKTNDPVRMYLREMGTVKLLDREGEVEIAKRIEKGERRVYKALSANRVILEEVLKIHEAARKDPRVIKEMIDLAIAETDEYIEQPDPKTGNKIGEIMKVFEAIVRLDKKIKDAFTKMSEEKRVRAAALWKKKIEKWTMDLAIAMKEIDFTPGTRNRMINKLKEIDSELSHCA